MKYLAAIFIIISVTAPLLAIDVSLPNVESPAGKTFQMPVYVGDLTGQNVTQYQFNLMYNPSILTATGISRTGTVTAIWNAPLFQITEGAIQVTANGSEPLTGTGILIYIQFTVNPAAAVGNSIPLILTSFRFNSGTPTAQTSNGVFLVIQDTTPPSIISGPNAESISAGSATIVWETDESANSVVEYGLDQSYGQSVTDNSFTQHHRIQLKNLAPAKTWHYRVSSTDAGGNGPTTSQDFTFYTSNINMSLPQLGLDAGANIEIPIRISEISGLNITDIAGTVNFSPSLLTFSHLSTDGCLTAFWRLPPHSVRSGEVSFQASGSTALQGSGAVIKLVFKIAAAARVGASAALTLKNVSLNNGSIQISTENGQFKVLDTLVPQIIGGPRVEKINSNSALVRWETDDRATSKIEFGLNSKQYDFTKESAARTNDHWVLLNGLTPDTVYYFQVSSIDSSGNGPIVSSEMQFRTEPSANFIIKIESTRADTGTDVTVPLRFTNAPISDITKWFGAIKFDPEILSVIDISHENTISANWPKPDFEVLGDLLIVRASGGSFLKESGVLFNIQFHVSGEKTNSRITPLEISYFTLNDGYPLVSCQSGQIELNLNITHHSPKIIFGPLADNISSNRATISWITDMPSSSQVQYGTDQNYGSSIHNSALVTDHLVNILDLNPNTSYHFIVLSADSDENEPVISSNATFQTGSGNEIRIEIPDQKSPPASVVSLPVKINQLQQHAIKQIEFTINYDPEKLSAGTVSTQGTVAADWEPPIFIHETGQTQIQLKGSTAIADTGTLVTIQFELLSTNKIGDHSPVWFSDIKINQGAIPVTFFRGMIHAVDGIRPQIVREPEILINNASSVLLFWETNEPTTNSIEYGTSTNYNFQIQNTMLERTPVFQLPALKTDTEYFFKINSRDETGSSLASPFTSSFRTNDRSVFILSLPDVGYDVGTQFYLPIIINGVSSENSVYSADFTLKYDPGVLDFNFATGVGALSRDWDIETVHTSDSTVVIHLNGDWRISKEGNLVKLAMTPHNPRRYWEKTDLILYNTAINGSPENVQSLNGYFTIKKSPVPQILLGPGVNDLHRSSAKIFWVTDKPGNTKIEYGLNEEYGLSLANNDQVTYHQLEIFGLQPTTTYHLKISTDPQNGASAVESADYSFITGSGNEIAVQITDTSLAIGKTFSLPVKIENVTGKNIRQITFHVAFDSTLLSPGSISLENTLCKNWDVDLDEVTPTIISGTVSGSAPLSGSGRLFEVQGFVHETANPGDISPAVLPSYSFNYGLIAGSSQNGFVTLIDQTKPQFVKPPQLKRAYTNSASIEWETDEPTTAIIEFGPDSLLEQRLTVTIKRTHHGVWLSNLVPNVGYAFRVNITDENGTGSRWSEINYFHTKAQVPQFTLPDVELGIGEIHDLPIIISGLAGESLKNYAVTLDLDGSVLVPIGVSSVNSLSRDWETVEYATATHRMQLSHTGNTPISEDGILLWISFLAHPKAKPGTQGWITVSKSQINSLIDSSATDTAGVTLTPAPQNAVVQVTLPDTTLEPGAWCQLPVQVSDLSNRGIMNVSFEIEYPSSLVSCGGGKRAGQMLGSEVEIINEFSKNKVRVSFSSPGTLSGAGTMLRVLFRVLQDAESGQSGTFHLTNFQFNGGHPATTTGDGSVSLYHYEDIIMGYIVERDSLSGIAGATVFLQGESNSISRTATTDNIGRFIFAGLDTNQTDTYTVSATKSGYDSSAPLTGIHVGQYILRMPLYLPDGVIQGKITTLEGFPIHNALVIAADSHGNRAGHYASTHSDNIGSFRLEQLNRVEPFQLTIEKAGFETLALQQIFADTSLWCVPDPYFSQATGQITSTDGLGLGNVLVKLTDLKNELFYDSTRTETEGNYTFNKLVTGNYRVNIEKPGYLSVNKSQQIEIEGNSKYQFNWQMQPAILDHFEITGATFIPNDARIRYRFQAWATAGETMELSNAPVWRLEPAAAGSLENGVLIPDPNYFSDSRLILQAANENIADSLRVTIYAPLTPASAITLTDYQGFQLEIPAGSVPEDTLIYLQQREIPKIKQTTHSWKTVGNIYALQPQTLEFDQALTMTFPLRTVSDSVDLRLGFWDYLNGYWQIVPDAMLSGTNSFVTSIYQGGLFAALLTSEVLGVHDIQLVPNPFSTEVDTDGDGETGLAIHFLVSSQESARPFVTIKIYNLLGELVRELLIKEPVEKAQPTVVRWNGLTDHHLKARNGRYLLRLIVEDGSGKKEFLKSIVLVK